MRFRAAYVLTQGPEAARGRPRRIHVQPESVVPLDAEAEEVPSEVRVDMVRAILLREIRGEVQQAI
jgi:hypothetical protein